MHSGLRSVPIALVARGLLWIALLPAGALAGCGQKGPLYLAAPTPPPPPRAAAPAPAPSASAPAAAPAR
ncbi:LPS translocon maturation chaperone LptM [Piscinibacter sakaiensis]|uniref:Lipoprotein n=1 Tax=Piscinibacter sakaiensis TaxID=1547922 RepID=A0A0K8NWL8_PISS1|nr:lipoprotein [Piscinibacter sakaiensis]GAP34797.1 hypothetical protein ISF6_0280 [Piscinibacter sakaiensis]